MEKPIKKAGDHVSLAVSVVTLISVLVMGVNWFSTRDQTDAVMKEQIHFINMQLVELKNSVVEQRNDIKQIHGMVARLEGKK